MADAEAGAAGKHGADGESEDESSGWETEEDEPETLAAAASVPPVGAPQNNKPDEEGEDEESEWETEESDNEEELDPNADWDPVSRLAVHPCQCHIFVATVEICASRNITTLWVSVWQPPPPEGTGRALCSFPPRDLDRSAAMTHF